MKHELKILPQHFIRVKDGSKTFEIRENDRAFQMGDAVTLKEYLPKTDAFEAKYTGHERTFKIGCVYPIDDKRVVFSLMKWNPE